MRNQPVLALDPVTDVLTGGEIRQGSQRSRRPCADRSRDRRDVAKSQEHLEFLEAGRGVRGSSELQKAGSPARHLEFEFSASRTAGEEVCVKPSTSHYAALSRNRLAWLWLSAPSLPSGVCFLKLKSGTGHLCYLMSWCQVTVLFWPDSD